MELDLDYKPHKYQQLIHQACSLRAGNPYRYITICAGRRAGKSRALKMQVLIWLFGFPFHQKIWYLMPSENQAIKIWEEYDTWLNPTGLIKKHFKTKGLLKFIFFNGSSLEIKSAGAGDNLRGDGEDITNVIVDEAAFIQADTINTVIEPLLMTTPNSKLVLASTPRGKSSHLYQSFLLGKNPDNKEHFSIHFTYRENPKVDISLVELAKKKLTEKQFLQEYEGKFLDSSICFNFESSISTSIPTDYNPNSTYFASIDFALQGEDSNCVVVMSEKGEVVFIDHFKKMGLPAVKKRIVTTLKKWSPKVTYIERSGMNYLYQSLKDEHKISGLVEYPMTNESKEKLIHNLAGGFEEDLIKIPKFEPLLNELDAFVPLITKSGNVVYRAAPGFHDDTVIALGLCFTNLIKNRNAGTYYLL